MTSSPTEPLLEAQELTRYHGDKCVVNNVSICVEKGEVLGLLGLNGAGKSSTLKMLAGLSAPSSGSVTICGHSMLDSPVLAKRNLGYLPETPPLYVDMRVSNYLRFAGKLRGLKGRELNLALDRVLHDCDLEQVTKRVIGNLSKGFRQRVGLAQALIHSPALILLDEPSSGLDPQQMIDMRALIERLSCNHGIVFSTHLLSEATQVCSHVCVINNGRLVAQQSLLEPANSDTQALHLTLKETVTSTDLLSIAGVIAAQHEQGLRWNLTVQASSAERLPSLIVAKGWHLLEFGPQQHELESFFSALVKADPLQNTSPNKIPAMLAPENGTRAATARPVDVDLTTANQTTHLLANSSVISPAEKEQA